MSKKKDQITKRLEEIGAAWAISADRYCGPNDPLEDQMDKRRMYHIHPVAAEPHQNAVERFYNLDEISAWVKAVKEAEAADERGQYILAGDIMSDFWASLGS